MGTSHLELCLPRTGVVAPNAAIVLAGHVDTAFVIKAQVSNKEVSIGQWGHIDLANAHEDDSTHYWFVKNELELWPKNGKVLVTAERMGQVFAAFQVPIGSELDTEPPRLSTLGAPTIRVIETPGEPNVDPDLDPRIAYEIATSEPTRTSVVAIEHGPIEDPHSPIVVLEIHLPNAFRHGAVREGEPGTIRLKADPEVASASTINAIMVRDTAENWVRAENPCKTQPSPSPYVRVGRFHCIAGTLEQAEDGSYIATTDAGTASGFSSAHFMLAEPAIGDLDITMTAEKLDDDERAVEIVFRGGGCFAVSRHASTSLLFEHAKNQSSWTPMTAPVPGTPLQLRVIQRGPLVRGFVDGEHVASFVLEKPVREGPIGVFFQGVPGKAVRIRFRDLEVKPLVDDPITGQSVTLFMHRADRDDTENNDLGERRMFTVRSGCNLTAILYRLLSVDLELGDYDDEEDTIFADEDSLPSVLRELDSLIERVPSFTVEQLCERGGWAADPARVRAALTTGGWPENGDVAEELAAFIYWLRHCAREAVEVNAGLCVQRRGALTFMD